MYCPCGFRDDGEIAAWRDRVTRAAALGRAIGTEFILIDGGDLELPQTGASIDRIAACANEAGRVVRDAGLTCTWHQHWGTLFQYPAEFLGHGKRGCQRRLVLGFYQIVPKRAVRGLGKNVIGQ